MNILPSLAASFINFFSGKTIKPESGALVHWAVIGYFGKPFHVMNSTGSLC